MKDLTKAEEQIMQVLWDIEEGVVHDIIDQLPDPKPAYNTVSTVVRILEKKEFVAHKAFGKTHVYFPLVGREEYKTHKVDGLMAGYFQNSPQKLVSFFLEKEDIDINELEEILAILKKNSK